MKYGNPGRCDDRVQTKIHICYCFDLCSCYKVRLPHFFAISRWGAVLNLMHLLWSDLIKVIENRHLHSDQSNALNFSWICKQWETWKLATAVILMHCPLSSLFFLLLQYSHLLLHLSSVLVLADQADPCKFLACNEFSRCVVNSWTNEAECLCDPGYSTVDGLPCQSTCTLQPNYCLNGGLCEIIPGHGATCRYMQDDKWKKTWTVWL